MMKLAFDCVGADRRTGAAAVSRGVTHAAALCAGLLLVALPGANLQAADVWSGQTLVEWIRPYPGTKDVSFLLADTSVTTSTCDAGKRVRIDKNHPNREALYAALLTAFAANMKINVSYSNTDTPECAPEIRLFQVFAN